MGKEKRNSRSYKSTDEVYNNAMKRAKKEKTKLASIIEDVVLAYGEGVSRIIFKIK